MALPAKKFEPEMFMEERVARLEANVEHIQSDVYEIKSDLRQLSAKVDGVKDSLAAFRIETAEAFGAHKAEMKDSIGALAVEFRQSISSMKIGRMADRIWWFLMSAALLGIMARAFKWI